MSTASIYNLLAISFDRYMAVHQPIHYPGILSKRIIRLMIFLVWAFSGLLALCLFILETFHDSPKHECTPMKLPSLYIIFSALASFIVPAVIMIVLNVSIFRTVLSTTRSNNVFIDSGSSMRIHRGKPKLSNKIIKQDSLYETITVEHPTISGEAQIGDILKNDKPMSENCKSNGNSRLKSFLTHVMVVSLISTNKRKHNNVMSQIGR
ncbi:hypothetical protein DICVIV_06413 [Dictyocaulus viviparus]|uniref:G-protein coupled receptors family 1 profile domain-containing protein n=1 Tax=Dictyocaulus viviparus TaxID=29172 RepID=A0A0D8XSG5_DICVI|nr:hypothetical protein DICVIV_06413 [Dictyocaulus viviparus]